jgi:hypothetical protein
LSPGQPGNDVFVPKLTNDFSRGVSDLLLGRPFRDV